MSRECRMAIDREFGKHKNHVRFILYFSPCIANIFFLEKPFYTHGTLLWVCLFLCTLESGLDSMSDPSAFFLFHLSPCQSPTVIPMRYLYGIKKNSLCMLSQCWLRHLLIPTGKTTVLLNSTRFNGNNLNEKCNLSMDQITICFDFLFLKNK